MIGSGGGRGIKEKHSLIADKEKSGVEEKLTTSGIGLSTKSDDTMNEDTPVVVTSVVKEGTTTAGNAPGKSSYANVTCKPSGKKVNVRTLFTPAGNRIDVVVLVDSIRAISKRFANTAYEMASDENLLKENVSTVPVWVKLHGVLVTAFNEDGLSAIATKLGTSLMLNSYTSNMCMQSWGRSSYARVMIKLRVDVELKDSIVVAMPKITREGHYTCNFRVEYEWKPPRCSSCKVFGHIHEECLKNTGAGEKKTVKKPSQTSQVSSGNKKKGVEPTIKVSNSNPFDVLNFVDNDVKFGTNGGTTNLFEDLLTSGQAILMDKAGNPLKKVEFLGEYDCEDEDTSSRSGHDADADDVDIQPVYEEEPMVGVPLTTKCNIFAIGQQHTEQPEIINEVLGKPILQPLRNQSVVRQSNVFKYEQPKISKTRFASQVDVKNNLSKPVTQHYLPKGKEYAFAKAYYLIASSKSRNSSKNMHRFSSNDMVHNLYLDEAKKKSQEKDRNSKTSVMPSARFQSTVDVSNPKPRSTNQTIRNWTTSKNSCVTVTDVPKADHSKNNSSFSDSKHFVFLTCQKCVFNANHDACITKFLKEVNSHATIQSHKTRNSNKPVEQKSHIQKHGRQIVTGHMFSPNKSSPVYEKTSPRSNLRWKLTGRTFKYVGLRWILTGKVFDSCMSKVNSEPPLGSNVDISKIHECKRTPDLSACTSINV
nr:hypothetical protein [Tanacetum cinerariifolium]